MPKITSAIDNEAARLALRRCALFSDLTSTDFDAVLSQLKKVMLEDGAILFHHKQPARHIFLLESGRMKLSRLSPDGHEKIIELVPPGSTFAEAIMFSERHEYPVSATAIMASCVWCVDSNHFSSVLRQSTNACFKVMSQMSRRLHEQVAEIDRLTLHNATFRLVSYLLSCIPSTHRGSSQVRLDTSKQIIASRLSVTPETLSRTFTKLHKDGLILINDNVITLNDIERLRHYAQGKPNVASRQPPA
ncbi:MAG: Crp/Fnr family transcriptional regulator [Granulosicoccus sp.]